MSEEKRKVKIGKASTWFHGQEQPVMMEIELPALTRRDRANLAKAEKLMTDLEADAPKRRALVQLELHENAEKGIRLEKEFGELKESYDKLLVKYLEILREAAQLKIEVEVYEFRQKRTFWTKFKDLFRSA